MFPKEFYILPEELFRLGNSHHSKLSNVVLETSIPLKSTALQLLEPTAKALAYLIKQALMSRL